MLISVVEGLQIESNLKTIAYKGFASKNNDVTQLKAAIIEKHMSKIRLEKRRQVKTQLQVPLVTRRKW